MTSGTTPPCRLRRPFFDDLTALDIVGPVAVLVRVPDTEVVVVAADLQPIHDARRSWTIVPNAVLAEVLRPDVIVIPGGPGVGEACTDERILDWIKAVHKTTRWTTSVCTGSIVLAAAGLLTGRRATCHWASKDELGSYVVLVTDERVTRDGNIVTSSGVSAGIDMALQLAALIAGTHVAHTIQLLLAPNDILKHAKRLLGASGADQSSRAAETRTVTS